MANAKLTAQIARAFVVAHLGLEGLFAKILEDRGHSSGWASQEQPDQAAILQIRGASASATNWHIPDARVFLDIKLGEGGVQTILGPRKLEEPDRLSSSCGSARCRSSTSSRRRRFQKEVHRVYDRNGNGKLVRRVKDSFHCAPSTTGPRALQSRRCKQGLGQGSARGGRSPAGGRRLEREGAHLLALMRPDRLQTVKAGADAPPRRGLRP